MFRNLLTTILIRKWDEAMHPRDEHGRFGAGGGGNDPAPLVHIHQSKAKELVNELKAGGFTYQPLTDRSPSSGLSVSPYPDREKIMTPSQVTPTALKSYVASNRDLLKDTTNHVGGWFDKEHNLTFLDVSKVVSSETEAAQLCKQFKQEAYYNLATGQTVYVGAHEALPMNKAASKLVRFELSNDPTDDELQAVCDLVKGASL